MQFDQSFYDMVTELENQGFSYEEAFDKALEAIRDINIDPVLDDDFATGGRVGLQEGGTPDYSEIVKTIMESYPEGDTQTIQRPSPQVEALQASLGPQLAAFLGAPISPTGGETMFGEKFESFLPQVAPQTQAQLDAFKLAQQQTMGGAGTGRAEGVAGFQPFLDDAATAAGDIGIAAAAGQGAGQTQLQNLADQANLAGLAAISGQNVGQPGITTAQNIADRIEAAGAAGQSAAQPFLDRAAQLAGPESFREFMSPYQQEVIDTTRQELERQLQAQQAQLGASAGSAFGGGRFGIAQGELGARGATGIAQTLAGLRQQGFQQAQQSAANALQQQLALGQAAQGQAGQNLALLGSGLQAQLAGSQAAQQQAGQNVGLLGQTGQMQLGTAQGLQQQAAQNVGLNQAGLSAQTGLAQLQPQLAAQNIGSSRIDATTTSTSCTRHNSCRTTNDSNSTTTNTWFLWWSTCKFIWWVSTNDISVLTCWFC